MCHVHGIEWLICIKKEERRGGHERGQRGENEWTLWSSSGQNPQCVILQGSVPSRIHSLNLEHEVWNSRSPFFPPQILFLCRIIKRQGLLLHHSSFHPIFSPHSGFAQTPSWGEKLLPVVGWPGEPGVDVASCWARGVCLCALMSAISNFACHSNRSKGRGPPRLSVHTLHHLPPYRSVVTGVFIRGAGWFGWPPVRSVSAVRFSVLAWTHCSQWPMVSGSQLWRPDVLSHEWRGPPAELLQLLQILRDQRLAGVLELSPGSRPPSLWSTQPGSCSRGSPASSFIPATAHPGRAKPDWQSPTASRASISFPPGSCPPPLSAFQSSRQLEGDPFLLSSRMKKSERMKNKEERGPSRW